MISVLVQPPPSLWTDTQTGVKTLPSRRTTYAGGNKYEKFRSSSQSKTICDRGVHFKKKPLNSQNGLNLSCRKRTIVVFLNYEEMWISWLMLALLVLGKCRVKIIGENFKKLSALTATDLIIIHHQFFPERKLTQVRCRKSTLNEFCEQFFVKDCLNLFRYEQSVRTWF